MYNFRIKSEMC